MHVQFLGRNPAPFEQKGISFENLLTIKKVVFKGNMYIRAGNDRVYGKSLNFVKYFETFTLSL